MAASTRTLDDRDRRLLALLRQDARTPVAALAKALNLSRSATQGRLARLEAAGQIVGYTIREPLETGTVRAWLMIGLKPGARCADLMPTVLARPEVKVCHSLAGPVDLMLLAETDAAAGLSELRDLLVGLDGVAEVRTAPVLTGHLG